MLYVSKVLNADPTFVKGKMEADKLEKLEQQHLCVPKFVGKPGDNCQEAEGLAKESTIDKRPTMKQGMMDACTNNGQGKDEEQSVTKENPDLVAHTKRGLIISEKESETVGQIISDPNLAAGQQAAISQLQNQAATEKVHKNRCCSKCSLPNKSAVIGMMTWYSKFIPHFSLVVEPLRSLVRTPNSPFSWGPAAEKSFQKLKQLLLESPAFALFDPALETIVTTDASDVGIGAVLSQVQHDGNERTVAFASRTLSAAERKYSVLGERSISMHLGCRKMAVLALCKGADRASLRIARWSMKLMGFNYDVKYKPGNVNVVADALSRLPVIDLHEVAEYEEDIIA
uniref:RT_RNaseH_2 domain-containing protein n=1 Tax=Trichuris muris TaxID=70415 RepID=A0A5S6QKA6_TRIMR